MQISSFRGAVTAAAMAVVGLFGTAPSSAWAQGAAQTVAATLPPPGIPTPILTGIAPGDGSAASAAAANGAGVPAESGQAWIARGTTPEPAAQAPSPPDQAAQAPVHANSLVDLVGDMPVPADSGLAPDMKCLAQAVYFESRGEPIEGQLAVAEVVINRAKSDLYPDDYCDVVTQRAQFSFVHRGRIPAVDETSEAWQRAVAIAEIAQQNLWQSKAADALYFHATYVNPRWARQKVELAQIDTHIFYR